MTKGNYRFLSILVFLLFAQSIYSQQKFTASLSARQVVPATDSTRQGVCSLTVDASEMQATLACNYTGLFPFRSAEVHIHGDAAVGANAPVIFEIPVSFRGHDRRFEASLNVTPQQLASLRSNRWYVDIHTDDYPEGEIRGQFKLANGTYNDVDGDGRADLMVYRSSENSFYSRSSLDGSLIVRQIGQPGDSVSLTLDFDGDGKSDFSTARYNNPITWRILNSSTDLIQETDWGSSSSGDFFATGDYDGDGRADLGVYRTGVWYILESSTGTVRYEYWGRSGDFPTPSDFDRDGKADLAITRSENGQRVWYIRRSSDQAMRVVIWGLSSDAFFSGRVDFDGDGASDHLVVRTVGGQRYFYVLRSSDMQMQVMNWGLSSDLIKLGDYDGDGRTDPTVIRTLNGEKVWCILQSSTGQPRIETFGITGDF